MMGLLQREAKEARSLNQRRLSQAADAAQAEELLREQVGVRGHPSHFSCFT